MYMELKRFSLKNLYGYKNIELVFNNEATIIIAENGAGKTTLINSLNAVLRGNADELRKLKCDSIEIDFKDKSYEINISELNFSDFLATAPLPTQFLKMMSFLKPSQIDDLLHDIKSRSVREIRESRNKEWYRLIYNSTPYGYSEIDNILTNIKRLLNNHYSQQLDIFQNHELGNGNQKNKSTLALEEIKNRMRNFDIIYLPTYRRIEKATLRDKYTIESDEKMQFRDGELVKIRTSSANGTHIEFGLYDVELELKDISESIERRSSLGYRTLSANIIEDMMTGKIDDKRTRYRIPAIDELSRFLGRVVNKDKEGNEKIIGEVTRIMKDKAALASNGNLIYFLSKLKPVIDSTKELEEKIESFVSMCNKYLQLSDDSKFLDYDVESLQVIVKDLHTNNPIGLEDLSSGEKQIISLMAHMYLDDTKAKIVLIDEPELSLSIEWQEHVLVDIVNSPSVLQMFAITHSPFVFNNELKKNVKSLNVKKNLRNFDK
ncbi:TPA: ATP-binding protein [Klebsiella pneumoniae]|nr:AAA family ATPase [Klebsiella pneumoniae]MCQ3902426.1 AAA family ATPase [Klebsiella quasipneumoniae]TNJ95297.1 ATP-binding protein [Klebsiella quasipneumoniae subsp. similipneumoniae]HCB0905631.1 AAA family ATPase [Klebsiella variicola subsp. variicola]MBD7761110.1 AAA family ATPase [Klebsiella pneumoniae]